MTPIVYPDPQLATRDLLRLLLAPHEPDATVSTRNAPTPDDAKTRPWVRVRSGGSQRGPASATAVVRVTVYGGDEGASMKLAAIVEALLLAEATSDDLRGFGSIAGPAPGTDPETGEPLALLSVSARLRPRHLRKDLP